MKNIDSDYLVIGCGAVSMAFVDTLMDEKPDATFAIIDRLHMPGGHWNHAYPFVRLHQPSALYGVATVPLGNDRIDTAGSNKGYYELASGAELLAYFDRVMRERFLPSGRVQYFPMHEYMGEGVFRSLLGSDQYKVNVGKSIVDGTLFNTSVPSMHVRKFDVADGVSCIAPNELPRFAHGFEQLAILGGGKTAMDVGVWLLDHGVAAEKITWICPRASWLLNRAVTQPGEAFFATTVGGVATQFEAMAAANSVEDLFLRMEAGGMLLRIDKEVMPSMYHFATISEGEVAQLSRIEKVIGGARVNSLGTDGMVLANGETVKTDGETLYIDCTASAVDFTDGVDAQPVFEEGLIRLQSVFAPLLTFSAAIIARLEGQFDDIAKKNALSMPNRVCDVPEQWMQVAVQNMMNQNAWSKVPELAGWLNTCRLNPARAGGRAAAMAKPENAALMERLMGAAIPAVMNTQKLIMELDAAS